MERGLNMMKQVSFNPALFSEGLTPFKPSLANLLATKGPQCKVALIAAVGIFAAANMKGSGLSERAQELAGFVADARAKISNIMNIPGVVTTIDEVGTAKYKELREQVALKVDSALNELGDYLTTEQKAMMKDWLIWGDAQVLQTVAATMKQFQAPDLVAQSTVLLNTLSTFYPAIDVATENKVMGPTEKSVQNSMNKFVAALIDSFKKAGAAEVASYQEHDKWVSDAAASTVNLISYGVDLSNGLKLATPFQAVGIVVATQMVRQFSRLQQASIEKKYPYPW